MDDELLSFGNQSNGHLGSELQHTEHSSDGSYQQYPHNRQSSSYGNLERKTLTTENHSEESCQQHPHSSQTSGNRSLGRMVRHEHYSDGYYQRDLHSSDSSYVSVTIGCA